VGHNNKIEILIDNSLERFNDIYAAVGHPNCIFKINFEIFKKLQTVKLKN